MCISPFFVLIFITIVAIKSIKSYSSWGYRYFFSDKGVCYMHRLKNRCLLIGLVSLFLLAGCNTASTQNGASPGAPSAEPSGAVASDSVQASAAAEQTPAAAQTDAQPKAATWVIDINDTQQITDELGIIWNYTLTFHATNPGGTDVLGDYTGDAVLKIEPDFDSTKAAAAREGTQLLSMLFNYHAECDSMTFEVFDFNQDKYAALMREYNPDNPLQQFDPGTATDFFAVSSATFNSTQEPVSMTIQTDEGPFSGSGGGGGVTVTVPFEITVDGATAYIFFYSMPHPGVPGFKGTLTGDVLPG